MKVIISGRRIEIEEHLKELIEKRLSKLDKFFRDDAEAKVTLTGEKGDRSVMEVTVFSGGMIYRAEENTDDAYTAIDKVVTVIERQIRKNKTRIEKKVRRGAFVITEDDDDEYTEEGEFRIRTKSFPFKPMSPEEAILQMNLIGHTFFAFTDDSTGDVCVVYKRKDGDYGLIIPER